MQVVRDIVHMYIVHPMPWGNEKKKKRGTRKLGDIHKRNK